MAEKENESENISSLEKRQSENNGLSVKRRLKAAKSQPAIKAK